MVTGIMCNRMDYKKNRTVQCPKKAEQTRAQHLALKEGVEASNKKEASEEHNNHSKEVSEDQDNHSKEVGEDQDNDSNHEEITADNQDGEQQQSREEYTNGDADTYQPATDDDQGAFSPNNKSQDIEYTDPAPSDAKKADPRFETQTQGGSKIHHIFIPPVKEKPLQKGPAAAPSVITPHQPTPPPSQSSTRHKVSQQVSYTPILTLCS
ncbi:hypothetical protein JB92DRAFT_3016082 [Gautieria morchelliformis]|nr:hypothetical protein JB92DRAFT_3016082 [Gautieria morchelliformis]